MGYPFGDKNLLSHGVIDFPEKTSVFPAPLGACPKGLAVVR
jgi:hypothetical protein